MNQEQFDKNVLQPLLTLSNEGDIVNEAGTKLIGHTPSIAPKAFVHIVYSPLEQDALEECRGRIRKGIPNEVESFLSFANGMIIFSGEIRVFGYEPLKKRYPSGIHNYPPSFSAENISVRIRGSSEDSFIVGWYQSDGSYVSIESNGVVSRFEPRDNGKIIQNWPNFSAWLTSEIEKYCKLKTT